MAFTARVYSILIASPSDVGEEREIAVKAIQEWNYLNAPERAVTLLPLRWETHAAPTLGDRPQAIINRQIVDRCDALIGIFWTRFGSPTGIAESGTLEEIERAVNAGKPAMLYFSSAPQRPDAIDTAQLDNLRKFKSNIQNKGLVQAYGSISEFKDLLARHIENQVRTLLSAEGPEGSDTAQSTQADIQIAFDASASIYAEISNDGREARIETKPTIVKDPDSLPDYVSDHSSAKESGALGLLSGFNTDNTNFFREAAAFVRDHSSFRKLSLTIQNVGVIGARDVHFDVDITSDMPISVAQGGELFLEAPTKTQNWSAKRGKLEHQEQATGWTVQEDVGASQPKRTIHWAPDVFIAAWTTCNITIDATIYADIFPHPVKRTLSLKWVCNPTTVAADEFVVKF